MVISTDFIVVYVYYRNKLRDIRFLKFNTSEILPKYSRNMTTTVTDVQQPDTKYRQTQRLELTPEEAKAWHECMRGSSVIMPALISAAVGYGACSVTPFRAYAKYAALVGSVLGLIGGRIAISEICLTKVASMPNSTLRDRLIEAGYYGNRPEYRERQYQRFQPLDVQTEVQSPAEPSTGVVFNDYPSMNAYDTYSSINDSSDFYISEDADLIEPLNLQKSVSYDELRYKNRDEFYKKNKQWHAPRPSKEPPVARETTEQALTTDNPLPMQKKTKYGDVWD